MNKYLDWRNTALEKQEVSGSLEDSEDFIIQLSEKRVVYEKEEERVEGFSGA